MTAFRWYLVAIALLAAATVRTCMEALVVCGTAVVLWQIPWIRREYDGIAKTWRRL
jgi:hypothetical protein